MFAEACTKARQYTFPIVTSYRTESGACEASIGAGVFVNRDGWAVTAWHILEQAISLTEQANRSKQAEQHRAAIYADTGLDKNERNRRLKARPTLQSGSVTDTSIWLGRDGFAVGERAALPALDVAFFRVQGFDPMTVQSYPVFKDPTKAMDQGRSLCRGGFPFHVIEPSFENAGFRLPPGSLPIPFFPNEGIYTRTVIIPTAPNVPAASIPMKWLETSSPGLRGQSGGPIFDVNGVIWAIQSRTQHFPLGFSPPVPGGRPNEVEHQFLNVGLGIHAESLVALMNDRGIAFGISDY